MSTQLMKPAPMPFAIEYVSGITTIVRNAGSAAPKSVHSMSFTCATMSHDDDEPGGRDLERDDLGQRGQEHRGQEQQPRHDRGHARAGTLADARRGVDEHRVRRHRGATAGDRPGTLDDQRGLQAREGPVRLRDPAAFASPVIVPWRRRSS